MSLFAKKSKAEPDTHPDKSGNNKLSLLIFLLLLAVFGYLYFFTSLIVPHEAPPAGSPVPTPQVKQAMPPRVAETAAPAGEVKKPQEVQPQAPAAQTTAAALPQVPAQKPAAPAPQSAAQKPATPAPQPAAQKPAPPAPAKVESKPAALPVKAEQKPSAVAEKKPAAKTPGKDAKPAPTPLAAAGKEQKPAKAEKAPAVVVPKKSKESFTLALGGFAAGPQAAAVEEKLDKLKIKPVLKQQMQKTRRMNRLFHNAYSDYDVSSAELEKLLKLAKSSFAVEKDGKYYIYAGSFSSAELAQKEKKRLSASGAKVELQAVQLPVSLVQISAGRFSARVDAEKAAARLRQQGLKVKVVPKKK